MESIDKLYKTDEGAALRFYWDTRKNEFQSEQRGRPVYDKVLLVEVFTPGSRESTPVLEVRRIFDEESGLKEKVNQRIYDRYKRQVDAFCSDEDSPDLLGTPLTAWPTLDAAMVATLKDLKIFTVEGLACLSDGRITQLGMGGRSLVERAKSFLAAAGGNAETERLAAENASLREDLERLTAQVQELSGRLAEAEKDKVDPPVLKMPTGVGSAKGKVRV